MPDHIYLYGPPGCGKSTLGRTLSEAYALPVIDLDEAITAQAALDNPALTSIPAIFAAEGEIGFRRREMEALQRAANHTPAVIALGGGALLDARARALVEGSGSVLCLQVSPETLLARLAAQGNSRPLLAGDNTSLADRLQSLMAARAAHYASFACRVDNTDLSPADAGWAAQVALGRFHLKAMGTAYDARVQRGALDRLGEWLTRYHLRGPVALVCDERVASLYAARATSALEQAGYDTSVVIIPAGEAHKTIQTVQRLWTAFAQARLERGSTILALGGGVVGDMTGFAAATFLRGVRWVNVPTTLLAMVDSSLGGKTGFDLPEGKNLVGAFYPPHLVLADPALLASLPPAELRSGLAETVKHGIIGDPELFDLCAQGYDAALHDPDALVRRSMAVKVRVIEADPYEKGERQALNLGHTAGHGIEIASDFTLSHGESIAIGTVIAAQLSDQLGIAAAGLTGKITTAIAALGLPTRIPSARFPAGLSARRILAAMQLDKKRAAGKVRFALPERIGSVRVGVEVPGWEKIIEDMVTHG